MTCCGHRRRMEPRKVSKRFSLCRSATNERNPSVSRNIGEADTGNREVFCGREEFTRRGTKENQKHISAIKTNQSEPKNKGNGERDEKFKSEGSVIAANRRLKQT